MNSAPHKVLVMTNSMRVFMLPLWPKCLETSLSNNVRHSPHTVRTSQTTMNKATEITPKMVEDKKVSQLPASNMFTFKSGSLFNELVLDPWASCDGADIYNR
jgi:hypothetical protein